MGNKHEERAEWLSYARWRWPKAFGTNFLSSPEAAHQAVVDLGINVGTVCKDLKSRFQNESYPSRQVI